MHTYNAMTGAIEAKAEAERRLAERERFVALGRLSSVPGPRDQQPLERAPERHRHDPQLSRPARCGAEVG
jgi:hypothetical protein